MSLSKKQIWAPEWKSVLIFVAIVWGTFFLAAMSGLNPARSLSSAFWGGVGGGLGAIVKLLINNKRAKESWITVMLPVAGFIVGLGVSKAFGRANSIIPPDVTTNILLSLSVGAACGLIPMIKMKTLNRNFGNWTFWISSGLGVIGGVVISLPSAILMTIVGVRKYK